MSHSGYTQLPSGSDSFNQRQQTLADNTYNVLQSASMSIQRSNQIAIETENMGVEVLGELGQQRETLLRTTRRLEDADRDLSKSRAIIRKLGREVLYNKVFLIIIILLELGILVGLLILKLVKQ